MKISKLEKLVIASLLMCNVGSGIQTAEAVDIKIGASSTDPNTYSITTGVGVDGKVLVIGNEIDKIVTWTGSAVGGISGEVYGIKINSSGNFSVTSITNGINLKSNNSKCYAIYLRGTGSDSISGLGGIVAVAGGTAEAVGIDVQNTGSNTFSVGFSTSGGSISTFSETGENYGILFVPGSTGTSEVKNMKTITAGIDPTDSTIVSSGAAYGIYAAAGVNTVAFVADSSIEAKSAEDVYGISFGTSTAAATGTTTISGLGSITATSTGSGKKVRGIFALNQNTAGASVPEFSVSFVDAGGSVSVYSTNGDNTGIQFANTSTGKSEVKNVKTITAGVKGDSVSAGVAVGICSYGGTNDVVFKENGTIIAKSNAAMAYGITVSNSTLTVSNLGGTTDGIIVSKGVLDDSFKIEMSGGTLNLKNSVIKATDDVITMVSDDNSSVNLSEGTKVYGPVRVVDTLTVNVDNSSEWHINKFDGTGAINVTNSGKFFIEGKLDLSGTTSSITSNSGSGIYFVLPSDFNKSSDTMLKLNNDLNIGSGVGVYVNTKNVSGLAKGDKITLVDVGKSKGNILSLNSTTLKVTTAGTNYYDATITVDGQKLIYTVGDAPTPSGGDKDTQKAPVEGVAAASAAVNSSSDLATGAGMSNLLASTATVNNTETFGAANFGNARYNSGSHVDAKGFGIMVGVGKKAFNKAGNKTTGGIFFEYGNSNFDTYNNNVTGEGKSIYKGGGYMMRFDNTCGNYYEGMIHAGKVRTNWSKHNSTKGESYDINPTYFGGALTYGHKFMVAKERQLAVYGSYIYTHTGGADAKIGDYNYNFDATNSHRTKVGVRYTASDLMDTSKFRPYVGLAWEHEYDAESRATVRGMGEAPAPSMKGDSGILELGFNQEVGKWTLGIGAEVFTGKRRGWSGTLQATYNF